MRRLLLIFLIIPFLGFGQIEETDSTCYCNKQQINQDSVKVFTIVEEMAEYPGGIDSLFNYLRDYMKFDYQINGKIWITFNVNCNGIACGFNTYKKEGDISEEIEIEIYKILKNMENWTPCKNRGRSVDCNYSLPIELINGKFKD